MHLENKHYGENMPYIDLTPLSVWGLNFQSLVGKASWARINKWVAERSGNRCELCAAGPDTRGVMGQKARKFRTEPRFSHDEASRIAMLERLVHACAACSQAIHLRRTELMSKRMPEARSPLVGAFARLRAFHDITDEQIQQWLRRELHEWKLRSDAGYPEYINLDIVENGTSNLWR